MLALTIPRFDSSDAISEIAAALDDSGVVIVENLLPQEIVQSITEELVEDLDDANHSVAHINEIIALFFGDKTKHVAGLVNKSKTFRDALLCHPIMMGLCDEILLPNCANYQLNLAHMMVRGPGADPQIFHRDEDIWVHLPKPHKHVELASMVALVDFTKANGGTWVVPGSHRWEAGRDPLPEEICYAEMSAGSCLLYVGATLHAGGGNTTASEWRAGIHLSYAAGWLRTEENNYLISPPDVAKNFSPQIQALLGYSIHDAIEDKGGYLGMMDLQDPMKVLFDN